MFGVALMFVIPVVVSLLVRRRGADSVARFAGHWGWDAFVAVIAAYLTVVMFRQNHLVLVLVWVLVGAVAAVRAGRGIRRTRL